MVPSVVPVPETVFPAVDALCRAAVHDPVQFLGAPFPVCVQRMRDIYTFQPVPESKSRGRHFRDDTCPVLDLGVVNRV